MPRINQRVLLILILISAALCGGLYGAYVFQVSRQTDFFLTRADKAVEEGQFQMAANLYVRVLEHDRNNPKALAQLAVCLDRLGKPVDAYIAYEMASRVAKDPDQYLPRQIELAIMLERWSDSERLLSRGLEKLPGDPELLLLMAQSFYRQGNDEQAVEKFREVLSKDAPPERAFYLLAVVLGERQKKVDEAEAVIDQLLKVHADAASAHVFAAQWYLEQLGDRPVSDGQETPRVKALREKISKCAQAALQLEPDSLPALRVGLRDARLRRDETKVMELAQHGVSGHPKEPTFYEFAAESAFRQGQPDVAAEWLERGLQKCPGDSTLLWDCVGLKLDRKEIDEAEELINTHRHEMTPVLRKALRGRVLVSRGRWKSALDEFNAIESELTSHPQMARVVNYEEAVCYGQLRQYDQQISALRRVLDAQPFWVEARENLARALYASGRTDEAVQEFRSVVANDKFTATSGMLMARLLIAQMSRRDAERADWNEVDTFLSKLDAGGVPHEEIVRLRCAMLAAMRELDQAETYVRKELDESANLPAFLGLALIQSEKREWDAALETIRKAVEKFGDSVEVRRAEALCLLASQKADRARLGELATPPTDWSAQQKVDLATQLLPIVTTADQLELAEKMVGFLIKNQPNIVTFRIEQLNIANRRKDEKLAASILADIERIAGRTAFWHYGQAVQIWTTHREGRSLSDRALKTAFHHLSEAALKRPAWAEVPLLHAMLLDSAGNSEAAISKYDQAIDLGVRDPQVIRRMVDLLMKAKRFQEADVVLRRLRDQVNVQSDTAPTLRIASEMSFHLARFENAVRLAEHAAKKSGSAKDYLWWARLLELQDRKAEASPVIAKAVELDPLSETVRLEQVRFLIRDGRTDDAVESVETFAKALNQREDSGPNAQLALAECYLALDKREKAQDVLVPLLDESPESLEQLRRIVQIILSLQGDSQNVPTVEEYLKRIITTSGDRDIQIWARRESALIAARDIRNHEFHAAMALVDKNLSIDSNSKEDIRAMALILAAWPNSERREKAISILEKLDEEGDFLSADDRFLLAQLSIVQGNWVLGSRLMRQILAVPDQQTEQRIAYYANSLIAQGEAQDGLLWAEKLLSSYPSHESVQLHARALTMNREIDRLLELLPPGESKARFADTYREFLTPRDSAEILGSFAEQLIESGRQTLATRIIERCQQITQSLTSDDAFPGSGIARVLAHTDRLSEALDILEQSAPVGSDLDVVQYVEAILAQRNLSTIDAERLYKIVITEQERRTNAAGLLLAKAQIQEKLEDFDGAITSYRQLISVDEQNVAALNNLAFLLAFRGDEPKEAVVYAQRAMQRTGPIPAIVDTYAVTLIQSGDTQQALEWLSTITKHKGLPVSQFHQAWAYYQSGDEQAARNAMLEAGKQGVRKESLHPLEVPIYELLRTQKIRLTK